MSKAEVRITCRAADFLSMDELHEFQGNLKTISRLNLDKLKRSILKHGFTAPVFIWKGVDNHILDGHQRLKALEELRNEGYGIPGIPVVYIEAENEKHAKEKLLYITSQYGDFDFQGIDTFLSDAGLTISELADIRFPEGELKFETPDFEPATEEEQGKLDELEPKIVTCPHCGEEFDVREQA